MKETDEHEHNLLKTSLCRMIYERSAGIISKTYIWLQGAFNPVCLCNAKKNNNLVVYKMMRFVASRWHQGFPFVRSKAEWLHPRQGDVPTRRPSKPGGRCQRVAPINETDAVIGLKAHRRARVGAHKVALLWSIFSLSQGAS